MSEPRGRGAGAVLQSIVAGKDERAPRAARFRMRMASVVASIALSGLVGVQPAAAQAPGSPGASNQRGSAQGATSSTSRAQSSGAGTATAAPGPEATRHFDKGMAAASANQWEKARVHFVDAWRLSKHWKIAANLGRAEVKTGRFRDAAEHLEVFLREVPPNEFPAKDRERVDKMYRDALTKVATVTVEVSEPGAEVVVDGRSVGESPLPLQVFVEPRSVTIEARKEGFVPAKVEVTAEAGKTYPVSLRLKMIPPPPPQVAGPNKGIVIAGVTTAALGIGGGVALAILSSVKGSDANALSLKDETNKGHRCVNSLDKADFCDQLKSLRHTQNLFGTLSIWGFAMGAVAGAATVAYVVASPKQGSESAVRVIPVTISHGGGLLITGEW